MDPRNMIRLARFILVAAAVGLAAMPLLIVVDLVGGGTGYGLCDRGVQTCRNPYAAAPRMTIILAFSLFAVLGGLRIVTHAEHRLRRRK